jgi:hypothetical protein
MIVLKYKHRIFTVLSMLDEQPLFRDLCGFVLSEIDAEEAQDQQPCASSASISLIVLVEASRCGGHVYGARFPRRAGVR